MNIIDIGSNSVRLFDGKNKTVVTTRLAEGMSGDMLSPASMQRTAEAIERLYTGDCIAYATEAVRKALNKQTFLDLVYKTTGLKIRVLSGEEEAEISFIGATKGFSGRATVIDLGGASCEIIFGENGKINYCRSFSFGCVTLSDKFGQNRAEIVRFIRQMLDVSPFSGSKCFAVGGTVTSLAAMEKGLSVYDRELVNGTILSVASIDSLLSRVKLGEDFPTLSLERRKSIFEGGVAITAVMDKLQIDAVTVSESDNLEGFAQKYLSNN